jgi:MFS transporter, DHA2 family, methylenomycin A resistance protein
LSTLLIASPPRVGHAVQGRSRSGSALAAAVLGLFVITLDAVVVNVALPAIRGDLGGGITGCSGWWTATRSCSPHCC